jgi:peptide/nickel transport system permease protein
MINLIVYLVVIAVAAWAMRFVGQKLTSNAPNFRDMSFGVAFGYVLGAALLVWLVWAFLFEGCR